MKKKTEIVEIEIPTKSGTDKVKAFCVEGIYLTVTEIGSVDIKVVVKMTRFRIRPAYREFSDGDWHRTTHWMFLPEPPKE